MKLKGIPSIAVAIAFGIVVLAGYFFPQQADGSPTVVAEIQIVLVNWAVILAGFALLVGVANLTSVHVTKIRTRQPGAFYSALLVLALLATFVTGLLFGPGDRIMVSLFKAVQLPVEASLMALLAVTLTYASIRLLRRRPNLLAFVFLGTALLTLLSTIPLPFLGNATLLSTAILPFLSRVLAVGGARGILIGVGLGALTAGLRVLFGADRPYGGSR